MIDTIRTERLTLRKAAERDLELIWRRVWADERLARRMLWAPTLTRGDAELRMARTIAYQADHYAYFVCLTETDEPIGFAGLREPGPGEVEETGLCIAFDRQRRGYGKETLNALTALAFGRLGAGRFLASCFHENTASAALIRSCGFVYTHSDEGLREHDGLRFRCDHYEKRSDSMIR